LNAINDKFFSILAHDLKNPIGNFKEITSILFANFDTIDDIDKREFLDLMNKSSIQVYNLLITLLDWSKSQQGKIVYHSEYNLVYLVIENVLNTLMPMAANKNIELINQNSKEISVYADTNMLSTIIRNLVSNAIKFTHPGGIIYVGSNVYDETFLQIYVKDNGVGMSDELVHKLFRIDANVTNRGTSNETGTGLGLLLSKEFVDKHGGTIWVESEVGKGTTFNFTIPIYK
jgi:signal transduction histidine kinase